MKWFLSYLWINVADINSEIRLKKSFLIQFKNERTTEILQALYDRIKTIYQFIKPFLDKYGAFK